MTGKKLKHYKKVDELKKSTIQFKRFTKICLIEFYGAAVLLVVIAFYSVYQFEKNEVILVFRIKLFFFFRGYFPFVEHVA